MVFKWRSNGVKMELKWSKNGAKLAFIGVQRDPRAVLVCMYTLCIAPLIATAFAAF